MKKFTSVFVALAVLAFAAPTVSFAAEGEGKSNGVVDFINRLLKGTGKAAEDTAKATGQVAEDTVQTAGNVVESTADGVKDTGDVVAKSVEVTGEVVTEGKVDNVLEPASMAGENVGEYTDEVVHSGEKAVADNTAAPTV